MFTLSLAHLTEPTGIVDVTSLSTLIETVQIVLAIANVTKKSAFVLAHIPL